MGEAKRPCNVTKVPSPCGSTSRSAITGSTGSLQPRPRRLSPPVRHSSTLRIPEHAVQHWGQKRQRCRPVRRYQDQLLRRPTAPVARLNTSYNRQPSEPPNVLVLALISSRVAARLAASPRLRKPSGTANVSSAFIQRCRFPLASTG